MSSSHQSLTGSTSAMASQGATASVSVQNNYFILAAPGELDRLLGQGAPAQTEIGRLALEANTSREALVGFLKILKQDNTPTEQLPAKLQEIADRYNSMMERLAVFDPEDAEVRSLVESAHDVLLRAASVRDYDHAEALLLQASSSQWRSISAWKSLRGRLTRQLAGFRRDNAATLAELAELSMTRLDYLQAAGHYRGAALVLAVQDVELRRGYLRNSANALYRYGDEKGDNVVLLQALERYRELLQETPRTTSGSSWAKVQNNLGNALSTLGERESGTARLEEAVAAYRSALEERTRKRVPLMWATTQNNLGTALSTLGERESGTASLEEAAEAYRSALEERTRERVPLDWAMTQNNLGTALSVLGEREGNMARLEQAVGAYHNALGEYTRDRTSLMWATTQHNLGNALRVLGERDSGTVWLEASVQAYESALEERTRERVPLNWAMTQNDLGNALKLLGEREAGTKHFEEARACIARAWEVCREAGMSHYDGDFELRLAEIDELIASRS